MDEKLREAAIEYHRLAPSGKIAVMPTKRMATVRRLVNMTALAVVQAAALT